MAPTLRLSASPVSSPHREHRGNRAEGNPGPCSGKASVEVGPRSLAVELSPRELEVVRRLALGESIREIGRCLFISVRTVEAHLARSRRKLGVRRTRDVVRSAFYEAVVLPPEVQRLELACRLAESLSDSHLRLLASRLEELSMQRRRDTADAFPDANDASDSGGIDSAIGSHGRQAGLIGHYVIAT
jgi:DNA-binding CsgD family transcriptional regulator